MLFMFAVIVALMVGLIIVWVAAAAYLGRGD